MNLVRRGLIVGVDIIGVVIVGVVVVDDIDSPDGDVGIVKLC